MSIRRIGLAMPEPEPEPNKSFFESAIDGFLDNLEARGAKRGTIRAAYYTLHKVRRDLGSDVWDPDSWSRRSARRSHERIRSSTRRGEQIYVEQFVEFLLDSRLPWRDRFKAEYGEYPIQPILDVNRMFHVEEYESEGRVRAATWDECRTFFRYLDDRARNAPSKREQRTALREGCESKLRLAMGLRNMEVAGVRRSRFAPVQGAEIFKDFGSLRVIGKAKRLGPQRPRTIYTVGHFAFIVKILEHYLREVLPLFPNGDPDLLFRHDDGSPLDKDYMSQRFSYNRTKAGLPPEFTAHSLRRTYATTLAIAGVPFWFISSQLGHEAAESTNEYTLIPDDYVERQLRIYQRRLLRPDESSFS